LKETYLEMEIKKDFHEELLSKIDLDFKQQLIDENDESINET